MKHLQSITLLSLLCLFSWGAANAQQASRSTFVKLLEVQEYWDQQKYDLALAELDELLAKTRDKPYDFALANQYLAHTCVLADCPARTRSALENALAQPGLPDSMLTTLKLFYGQVLLVDEEFAAARDTFEEWLVLLQQSDGTADPTQLFSAAYANYQTKRYQRAGELLEKAILGKPDAPLSWRQLQYHTLFELERYSEAETVALELATRSPADKAAWQLLSNHYLRREDGLQALTVLAIAYQQEVLDSPADVRRLVSLYSAVDIPERGARLLEKLLQQSLIDADFDALKLAGDLWLIARERDNALRALTAAAELAADGRTDELVGSIYFEEEQWQLALAAFERSISKDSDQDNARLHLLAGLSAARAGLKDTARQHLRVAMNDKQFRAQANNELRDLEDS
ncbi:MAG: tetratricopeptide repeat protein [Woeseia sp.]